MNSTTNSKEDKIPNTIIIYLKTRIPNYLKLTYEPSMTVPDIKSSTVFFDPLVKYHLNPVQNATIYSSDKDAIYNQFFESGQFDTMIYRTLSDFRYMQKPKTFQEAYHEHIIENNIDVTLKTLFKPNSVINIGKEPYTIVGSHWNSKAWQIEKKPLDKLLSQFPHMSPVQLETEAAKEETSVPEIFRQGNLASQTLAKEEQASTVLSNLQKASEQQTIEPIEVTETFMPYDSLPKISDEFKQLYTEQLHKNIPINYSDFPDKIRDPITLSILITPKNLLEYVNKYKNENIINLYSSFVASKIKLQEFDTNYTSACIELTSFKQTFNDELNDLLQNFYRYGNQVDQISTVQTIVKLKTTYMKTLFDIADVIMMLYKEQHTYFTSLKNLLVELKSEYGNIIEYYKTPELAIKCIEYDINNINSLLELNIDDKYSQSYFENYEHFKNFYTNQLYKYKQELLMPEINYSEEIQKYIEGPQLLLIEKEQYFIYDFKLFLFYSYNQLDIWSNLFKPFENFTSFIRSTASDLLVVSQQKTDYLNAKFNESKQEEINNRLNIDGYRADYDKKNKSIKWYFVKSDGSQILIPKKGFLRKPKMTSDEYYQHLSIERVMANINSFDVIMLYTYIIEILCLRQTKVYIAEENVNYLNLEFSIRLDKYYDTMKKYITRINDVNKLNIPKSLLWDVSKLNDLAIVNEKMEINDRSYIIYKGRTKTIQNKREDLNDACDKLTKSITPTITQEVFLKECNKIVDNNGLKIPTYNFKSSYWLNKSVKFYDIQTSNELIYGMNKVVKEAFNYNVIDEIKPDDYLDWSILTNEASNTIDSLYQAVAYALNGQMDIDDSDTTNPYTTKVNGKNIFTLSTLQKMVYENNPLNLDINDWETVYTIIQMVLRIRIILFELTKRDAKTIQIGDNVIYKRNKYKIVSYNPSTNTYGLFNGFYKQENVPESEISQIKDNLYSFFRIYCKEFQTSEVFDDFMFVSLSKDQDINNNSFLKFKLVQYDGIKSYIFQSTEIPKFVSFFIFNSCVGKVNATNASMFGLSKLRVEFAEFIDMINKPLNLTELNNRLDSITQEMKEITERLAELNVIALDKGLELEEEAEKILLIEEIKDLRSKQQELNKIIRNGTSAKVKGGAVSDQTITTYQPYQPYQSYQPYQVTPSYQANIYKPNSKETKSKLAFYITVELELFPGTSVNLLDKSVVKCQSVFERIREAWSDIFGYQYRPSPMHLKKDTIKNPESTDEKKPNVTGGTKRLLKRNRNKTLKRTNK